MSFVGAFAWNACMAAENNLRGRFLTATTIAGFVLSIRNTVWNVLSPTEFDIVVAGLAQAEVRPGRDNSSPLGEPPALAPFVRMKALGDRVSADPRWPRRQATWLGRHLPAGDLVERCQKTTHQHLL